MKELRKLDEVSVLLLSAVYRYSSFFLLIIILIEKLEMFDGERMKLVANWRRIAKNNKVPSFSWILFHDTIFHSIRFKGASDWGRGSSGTQFNARVRGWHEKWHREIILNKNNLLRRVLVHSLARKNMSTPLEWKGSKLQKSWLNNFRYTLLNDAVYMLPPIRVYSIAFGGKKKLWRGRNVPLRITLYRLCKFQVDISLKLRFLLYIVLQNFISNQFDWELSWHIFILQKKKKKTNWAILSWFFGSLV